ELRDEKIKEYKEKFANPYVAAEKGWIDAVIEPNEIRQFLITSLKRLKNKKEITFSKKHGNIPL
ncbi:MAG: methylmalonyl-CoA carboxyltransferase, partial [Deltaproteobacteria bacterium]